MLTTEKVQCLPETRAQMYRHIFMSLFKSLVLLYKVKKVSANDNGSLHLHFGHHTSEDTATDAHVACEWTFLVDVSALCSLQWTFYRISVVVTSVFARM